MELNFKFHNLHFHRNEDTKFYRVDFDEKYFASELINRATRCAVFLCKNCNLTNLSTNLENTVHEIVGDNKQDIYVNCWDLIVDEKFVKMMNKYDILGFQTKDAVIIKHNLPKRHIKRLKEVDITGRVYSVYTASGEKLHNCPYCLMMSDDEKKKTINGIMFKHSDWDGSDIFRLRKFGHIFVTDKFKDMIEKEYVEGIYLTEISMVML